MPVKLIRSAVHRRAGTGVRARVNEGASLVLQLGLIAVVVPDVPVALPVEVRARVGAVARMDGYRLPGPELEGAELIDVVGRVAEQVDRDLDQRWNAEFLTLADGKRLLGEFVAFTGFRSLRDLLAALTQTAHDHAEVLPPGFVSLRDRLLEILPGRANEGRD